MTGVDTPDKAQGKIGEDVGRYRRREQTYIRKPAVKTA